jgi:hypothetical protein
MSEQIISTINHTGFLIQKVSLETSVMASKGGVVYGKNGPPASYTQFRITFLGAKPNQFLSVKDETQARWIIDSGEAGLNLLIKGDGGFLARQGYELVKNHFVGYSGDSHTYSVALKKQGESQISKMIVIRASDSGIEVRWA